VEEMLMKATQGVIVRLNEFVKNLSTELENYYSEQFTYVKAPSIEVSEGPKFFKIISFDSSSRSVFCFIDKANGNILKASSWNAPAKHPRGSIFEKNYGWGTALNAYGAVYMQ
jgi:hypothetical protein